MPSLDGGDDFVGVGRPCEWLRVGVGLSDEAVDGRLEIDDGAEDTTFQSTSAELGEKPLDSVEPGARGWCEVENETRVAIEPCTNVGVFVSCIVVENDVDGLADRNLRLDGVQKSNEFLMTMTLHVAADDRAVEDVEGGEQRRGAVPLCNRVSWFRAGPSSAAGLAGCGRGPESGSHGDLWVKMFGSGFHGKSPVVARIQGLSPFA